MEDVIISSAQAESAAVEAVGQHHAQLSAALAARSDALLRAVAQTQRSVDEPRQQLVRWCRDELVPHALAEEKTMYPAARSLDEGRLLIQGMLMEHQTILSLVDELESATDPVAAAAAGRALSVVFDGHRAREDELIMPLLAAAPSVSLAELLGGMHSELDHHSGNGDAGQAAGQPADVGSAGAGGHACGCGESDHGGYPELDARTVPHAIRHATVFGALDAVQPGGGMILVAPHDPLPLLAQIEQRHPEVFAVDYLERGPEAWRLQFTRQGAAV